jgi:hypothetical protein
MKRPTPMPEEPKFLMLLTPIVPRSLTLMELEKGINFYMLLHVLHG